MANSADTDMGLHCLLRFACLDILGEYGTSENYNK